MPIRIVSWDERTREKFSKNKDWNLVSRVGLDRSYPRRLRVCEGMAAIKRLRM